MIARLHNIPRFWRHLFFWMLYFGIQAAIWMQLFEKEEVLLVHGKEIIVRSGVFDNYMTALKSEWMEAFGKFIAVYFNMFVLIPRLLLTKRFFLYAVSVVCVIGIASLLQGFWAKHILFPLFFPHLGLSKELINFPRFIQYFAITVSVVVFTGSLKILQHYYHQQNQANELAKQKLDTELNFLKTQINPHFFFNTLNNLYGLALQQSTDTPEMILKLSEMMHYILYEAKADTIDLGKEIEFIEHYIALEKLRYGDALQVRLNIDCQQNSKIPPLMLLPFVENAFKHGFRHEVHTNAAWVDIVLTAHQNIEFSVTNTVLSVPAKMNQHHGLGLTNLKRQLELLFPSHHEFRITTQGNVHTAYFKIFENLEFKNR